MKKGFLFICLLLSGLMAFAQPAAPTVSGNTTICTGNNTVLTANGAAGATFKWYDAAIGGTLLTNTASYTIPSQNAIGTYHFYVEQSVNSLPSARTDVIITVNQTPTVAISPGSANICNGGSTMLTASGATTYLWSNGITTTAQTVSPTVTTAYTVTGITQNCPSAPATATVSVYKTVVTPSGAIDVCYGANTTLSASGASTYLWSAGGATTPSITVSPTANTTYTVTGSAPGCATTTDTVRLNVRPDIGVFAGGNQTITEGSVVALTAGSATATSYVWTPNQSSSLPPLSGTAVSMLPTTTTTYTVTGTDVYNCTATAQTVVTVNKQVSVAGTTTVCAGSTTTLTASGTGPFAWYNVATGGTALSNNPSFTTPAITANTAYWVAGSNGVRKKVNISLPAVANTPFAFPAAVCAGDTVRLRGRDPGGINWYDAPVGGQLVGNSSGGSGLVVTAATTKTYWAEIVSAPVSLDFAPIDAVQTWTVPEGVTSVQVNAYGSKGSTASSAYFNYAKSYSGKGGSVTATLNVVPGQVLNLFVGGTISWNGGGLSPSTNRGGDATDIRIGGTDLLNRVLVAGGGGGSGWNPGYNNANANTGAGGGLTGQDGGTITGFYEAPYWVGQGGSQTAGGQEGYQVSAPSHRAEAGSFGRGGTGRIAYGTTDNRYSGGGGGGGFYGGGSGMNHGDGGGGSSYTNPAYCSNVTMTQGTWDNPGTLTITYSLACGAAATRIPVTVSVTPIPSVAITSGSLCLGTTLTAAPSANAAQLQWMGAGGILNTVYPSWNATAATVAGTTTGGGMSQLSAPQGAFAMPNGDLYIPDGSNHRIMKWSVGATTGTVVAGGNGAGTGDNQLNTPAGVYVDESGTLYIADKGNHRIQKWTAGAASGTTLFGTTGSGGTAASQLYDPVSITRDTAGRFYITEAAAHRVSRWVTGQPNGVPVAGTAGNPGSGLAQLTSPASAVTDKSGAVYVADGGNSRVVKWAAGAATGTLFAGGNGSGNGAKQVSPAGISRDGRGNIYIADGAQARIQRWAPGDTAGTTVAPLAGSSLTSATGVCFDLAGNMYVTDGAAGQVKKWSAAALTPLTYVPTASGIKSAIVTNAFGCAATSDSITLSDIPTANLSPADSVCVGGAVRVLTMTGASALAPYTFQYTVNGGAVQTAVSGEVKTRYIRIKQNLNDWTNLAEVEAIDFATGQNVALNKPATASSNASGYAASMITDGNKGSNNYWHSGAPDDQQYVEIDLGGSGYNLSQVKITNRPDCCHNRARNLQLILKDSAGVVVESRQIDAYQNQNNGYTAAFSPLAYYSSAVLIPTATPSISVYKLVSVAAGGCVNTRNDSTRIKVNEYSNFISQPLTALNVCSGNPFTLSAKATNATGYQWQKNGGAIGGQTDTSFTNALAGLGDGGAYRLIALNAAGCNDTSVASNVTVNETPDVTLSGGTAYCKNTAGVLLTLNSSGANLDNTVQYTLNSGVPVSVSLPSKKIRYIRVQNDLYSVMGITEIKAFVPGNATPVSGGKPVVTTATNSNAIYSGAHITDGDLNTSWLAGGNGPGFVEIDLQNSYPLTQVQVYAGTSSGTGFGNNYFQLICKDSLGNVVSDQWTLIYPPSPAGPVLQNWSVPVTKTATIAVPTGVAGTNTYRLSGISSSNGCALQKTDSIQVAVSDKPFITQQPADTSNICESSPLTLAGSSPTALGYKWLRDGGETGDTTATLSRASLSAADAGTYRLVSIGLPGCNDTSTAAVVKVRSTPEATIAGEVQLCQGAFTPDVTFNALGAETPYTFKYAINGDTSHSVVTGSDRRVRYVRVKQNTQNITSIAELRAIDLFTGQNVAQNKPVVVSSVFSSTYSAIRINDGSTFNINSWRAAVADSNQYAEIDLGAPGYYLSEVQISSSACCQAGLGNLQLIFKDAAGALISSRQVDAWQQQNAASAFSFPTFPTAVNKAVLPVSSAVSGLFSYRLMSVSSGNGCSRSYADSVQVAIAPKATITTHPLTAQNVCAPNPLVLSVGATDAVFYRWQRNNVNIFGANNKDYTKTGVTAANAGTYRVIAITPDGCNDTSVSVVVTTGSMVSTLPATASATDTLMQLDGMDYTYTSANCEPIAEVTDAAGGNMLGMVIAQVVKEASVQTFNLSPYLQRHYDIQPANNGAATVKLYATQAEFDAYNAYITANNLPTPKLPAGPGDTIGIANISVMQFHGLRTAGTTGPGGQYNAANKELIPASAITKTWNGNYWTMSFPVSGFSGFFITSTGNSTPLPLSLTVVSARNLGSTNEVLWTTATEDPATIFEVERSLDAAQFSKIGTLQGTGKENTSYRLVDAAPATGINYYRIRAIAAGGESVLSRVVTATVKAGVFVVEAFPNPTRGLVTVRLSGVPGPDAVVVVSDVSGRLLWQVPMRGSVLELSLTELAGGLYFLRYQDGNHSQTLKITRE